MLLNINKRVACSVPYTSVPFKARTTKTSHDVSDCFVVGTRSQGQATQNPDACLTRTTVMN